MSEMDGNVNINDILQVIRFSGDGLKAVIKGSKWAWDKKSLLVMKGRLAMHYHSKALSRKGELRKGISLHRLEKLTGGNYGVLNIPTENETELAKFLNVLRKQKIAYSLLPDLIPDNGYTQIAFDPAQQTKLDAITEVYSFEDEIMTDESTPESEKAKVIDFEEYWEEGNSEEKEKIVSTAIDEAKKEQTEELKKNPEAVKKLSENTKKELKNLTKFEKMQMRHRSRDYYPVTIDEKMIVAETEKAYVTKVPGSYNKNTNGYSLLIVKKDDAIATNGGHTILTHFKKDGETCLYDKNRQEVKKMSNMDLYDEHYRKFNTEFDRKKGFAKGNKKIMGKTATLHSNKNLKK